MKKILSLALALVLVLSMSTVAFAADYNKNTSFNKEYVVTNGTAPAETFDFDVEYQSFKNNEGEIKSVSTYPTVTLGDAVFTSALSTTDTAAVPVEISNYDNVALGVYTYKITEVVPATKTAGTTYNSEPVYLVVTILRDEESTKHYVAAIHYETATGKKTGKITNSYNAGQLSVTKNIEGNMADMTKKFNFTITFTAPVGTEIKSDIKSDCNTGTWSTDGLTYMISLGDGEKVILSNIPAGTTYTVTENAENYTSDGGAFNDNTKTISANDHDTVTFTNTLTQGIDTGINLDSMPYILMLAVVCMGLFVFFSKKRMMREN